MKFWLIGTYKIAGVHLFIGLEYFRIYIAYISPRSDRRKNICQLLIESYPSVEGCAIPRFGQEFNSIELSQSIEMEPSAHVIFPFATCSSSSFIIFAKSIPVKHVTASKRNGTAAAARAIGFDCAMI